ncbi:MAG: bifunctional 5,10-methylenetetrahydrofolate dehydrogenase/5,10-methenyltetrahydrofolate cyclohydrolase [Candidatus Cyclobacteriaceae bacterium M3_2C_046]
MQILDGKKVAAEIRQEIEERVQEIKAEGHKTPHLAAILVGNDPASQTYVNHKVRDCELVGFQSTLLKYDDDISESFLLKKIEGLNDDPDIDGFIVQLPLPDHISGQKVIAAIDHKKDVDGFHPLNAGRLLKNLPCFISATPNGILMLMEKYEIETAGKHCVVLGRSEIVGSPMSILMARKAYPGNCTVTLCHSKTQNIKRHTLEADIIIAAMGKPGFIKEDMVKEGTVVIDVGTTRVVDSTKKSGFALKGDVDFDAVAPKCSYITPVPGGVGPLTRASLLWNTLLAAEKSIYS